MNALLRCFRTFTIRIPHVNNRSGKCLPALVLLPLLLGSPCPAQVAQIFTYPKEQRVLRLYHFVRVLHRDSTSFIATMDSIQQLAHKDGDKKFDSYTRLFRAAWLTGILPLRTDAETPLIHEKEFFEATSFPDVKAAYYFYLGQLYDRLHNTEEMFHYFIAAADLLDKSGWNKCPTAMWFASYLFETYYRFQDYLTALRFIQLATTHIDTTIPLRNRVFLLNNMGETHLKLNDLTKAKDLFQQVIQIAKERGDVDYVGIGSGNYGNTLRLQGQYREALPYLYQDLALNEKTVPENSAITCAYIALCLLHTDSLSAVPAYLQKAARLRHDWNWYSFYPPYHEAWSLYYKKQGRYQQASLYQDSLLLIKDSLKKRFNTSVLLTTSLTLKEQRRLVELREKELETQELRLVRNVVVGAILVLFALVVGLLVRKRKKEQAKMLAHQRQAEEKLKLAERDLAHYLATIREKNVLIEKLEKGWSQTGEEIGSASQQLQQLRHVVILTDADWKTFKQLFEEVYPNFFARVRSRYLGLTEGDERLLALYKLNLPPKEMAAMLGISTESLRTSRYRLRKKYPSLSEDDEFKQPA